MQRLVLDLETRSELDVKEVGPHKYAAHPSTEIMAVGYKIDKTPAKVWLPLQDQTFPKDLKHALEFYDRREPTRIVAHNAEFEMAVWNNKVKSQLKSPHLWLNQTFVTCTAARATHFGYPRKLETLAKALELPAEKNKQGHRVMMKLTKPRTAWHKDRTEEKWHDGEIDWLLLAEYCATDVEVEAMVDDIVPELPPFERKLWDLTCRINADGILTDQNLIKKVIDMMAYFQEKYSQEFVDLTEGRVKKVTEIAQFVKWLFDQGCVIPDLQKQTIIDYLKVEKDPVVKRALELRQLLGKSSTAKFQSFFDRADNRGVVRDLLVYGGATPTLRWSGSGIQPQNFPRGTIKDIDTALNFIDLADPELIEAVYDSPFGMFSSCLRSMILPTNGFEDFVCADFAQIETRGLFWIANETRGLEAFANGDDLYKEMAAEIFNKDILDITPEERFVGKESVLGCGFGMGAPKFVAQCAAKNSPVSPELGKRAVNSYRHKFKKVVAFWKIVETACIKAIVEEKRVKLWVIAGPGIYAEKKPGDNFFTIELPSGRKMFYPFVKLQNKETHWGELKATITYMGVDSKTKQWQRESTYGGKLTENICQGIARDLMAQGMLNCEALGAKSALTVHDELLANRPKDLDLEKFVEAMTKLPAWAKGYPLKAEGWVGPRYRK